MRYFVFYILLGLSVATASFNAFLPYFDYNESQFVSNVLQNMEKYRALKDGAYTGPFDTAYIAGYTSYTPIRQNTQSGYSPHQCMLFEEKMEYYSYRSKRSSWHQLYKHQYISSNIRIRGWSIDPTFLTNPYLPYKIDTKEISQGQIGCTHERCRITTKCLQADNYSVIGVRSNLKIQIPDASLYDYPLMQLGIYSPAEFDKIYAVKMADRTTTPYFLTSIFTYIIITLILFSRSATTEHYSQNTQNIIIYKNVPWLIWTAAGGIVASPILSYMLYGNIAKPQIFFTLFLTYILLQFIVFYLLHALIFGWYKKEHRTESLSNSSLDGFWGVNAQDLESQPSTTDKISPQNTSSQPIEGGSFWIDKKH